MKSAAGQWAVGPHLTIGTARPAASRNRSSAALHTANCFQIAGAGLHCRVAAVGTAVAADAVSHIHVAVHHQLALAEKAESWRCHSKDYLVQAIPADSGSPTSCLRESPRRCRNSVAAAVAVKPEWVDWLWWTMTPWAQSCCSRWWISLTDS